MIHLIIAVVILVGTLYLIANMIVLAGRVIWLAVLIVAWCVVLCTTVFLGLAIGAQKLIKVIDEWRWRRRYGEILPPE
jgi:hypothetical protein